MSGARLIKYLLSAMALGAMALGGADRPSAAPVLSNTVAMKATAPEHTIDVGYDYWGYGGPLIDGPLAVGFLGQSAVSPFYLPAYYPPYIYYAPPIYYVPPIYYGPAVVYGRPLYAPSPYYPTLYPYVPGYGH
jgi:hypothetical protein